MPMILLHSEHKCNQFGQWLKLVFIAASANMMQLLFNQTVRGNEL